VIKRFPGASGAVDSWFEHFHQHLPDAHVGRRYLDQIFGLDGSR